MYKERVMNLLNEIDRQQPRGSGLRDMMFSAVENGFDSFVGYVNSVYHMETSMLISQFRIDDPIEFQAKVKALDDGRRRNHDGAIAAINMLDRICDKLGIEPIYGGSQDRNEIGDFCGAFVNEYFDNRVKARVVSKEDVEHAFDEMGFER